MPSELVSTIHAGRDRFVNDYQGGLRISILYTGWGRGGVPERLNEKFGRQNFLALETAEQLETASKCKKYL